jgi:2,4-dienoyl-CoA reductase-like NADH-dependent reductase (Old Yellow Enzyme family)/thioredoxin reductase
MEKLFTPIKLGSIEISNRVVLAPMGLGLETYDEIWPERYFPFIEERCRGETGLIITHFTNATSLATSPISGIYDDRFLSTHKRFTDMVHHYDSKVFVQLAAYGGRVVPLAPSAIESPWYPQVPRELTIQEIKQIIQDFGVSAARARRAGYDGVELHGGYLYLVGAFISPHSNRRQDDYGGDFERRMRFPVEIAQAIKREAGDDFPMGFKFGAWEELPDGIDLDLGVRIAQRMAQEAVCYLQISTSEAYVTSKFPSLPTMYVPRNTLLPIAVRLKKAIKDVPVMSAGAINDPIEANDMIERGDCDLVALGRALLADPYWVRKARLGQRIRPCIRCNVCHQTIIDRSHKSIFCTVNPYLVNEAQEPLPPIRKPKRVMVIGGGPAGIMAALTADKRGHQVTLYEKNNELGGELIPGSQAPFKADLRKLVKYWNEEITDSGVQVKLNSEVDPELIRREKPDAVVIAIGSSSIIPEIPGIRGQNVTTAVQAFLQPNDYQNKRIVVLGGGEVGCECAVFLAQHGCKVTIVELLHDILLNSKVIAIKLDLLRMVTDIGIEVLTSTQITEINENGVFLCTSPGSEKFRKVDGVVVSVGMKTPNQLTNYLAGECQDVRIIGDSLEPRRIRDAVVEGDLAGRMI